MKEIYKTHGIYCVEFAPNFACWECPDKKQGIFFDTVRCPALSYEDIPLMIDFLEKVKRSKEQKQLHREYEDL